MLINYICDDVSMARALIKHGEITALEDSKATPQKVVYQYMAKNQN